MKLWAGRFSKETDERVNDFNSSISVDGEMFRADITGSLAHAAMLAQCKIISDDDLKAIQSGLAEIFDDIESGKLKIDQKAEDIHTFIEAELTKRVGDPGKRLHTARSRNDQVATDTRKHLLGKLDRLGGALLALVNATVEIAKEHKLTIMPGYTHLQRAQPVSFAHHMLAYAQMFLRDLDRMMRAFERTNEMPLGAGALAGTTYPINREITRDLMAFGGIMQNSLDAVSDRDFCVDAAHVAALVMVHLSRLSEEIILWCSWEFKFIELDDGFATGSSIMPQKKNPDVAELVRGKSGRVFGDLMALLTMLKGLPLAYNKDMQEDKEAVFDALDTAILCAETVVPMLETMTVLKENMARAAGKGFINATDCADYLTKKGMPFRDAYKITGEIVAACIKKDKTLDELSLAEYKEYSQLFAEDIYEAVDLLNCLKERKSEGGPSPESVDRQLAAIERRTEEILNERT